MGDKHFYHISLQPLAEGIVLENGRYGNRIRAPQYRTSNYPQYMKEEIFEDIRVNKFPDTPSRLESVFLFPSLISAKFYRSNWNKYNSYIYEIEIVSDEPFIVEMDLLNCNGFEYNIIKSCAEKYWGQIQHPDSCTLEAILKGEAIVKDLISAPSIIW